MNGYEFHVVSTGKWYSTPLRFAHRDALPQSGFASLYAVSKEDAEALGKEGTAREFKGVVWSPRLQIDFDDEQSGVAARRKLKEMELEHTTYRTGNRGVHISIERYCDPSHLLPARDREWVQKHFPEADASIYTHLHLFRLPGAVHEATGLRKHETEKVSGKALALPQLRGDHVTHSFVGGSSDRSVFDSKRIMSNSVPAEVGERHAQLVRCCYALKDYGVPEWHAEWWLNETNKLFRERKTPEQVAQIIQSIYR